MSSIADRGQCAAPADALSYLSLPIAWTQPARLAATAGIFGVNAPAPHDARVLEIGCASGGNLIPLAVRFPASTFVGVDRNAGDIDTARADAAALGCTNIDFVACDVADLKVEAGVYDYIVCHGVFSWVPASTRAAILALCARGLARSGLAAISFNVLPGWRMQQAVRDLCLHHGSGTDDVRTRIARARAALAAVAASARAETPYGLAMRQAAARLERRPDSYLLGEFLAKDNTAFFMDEFADQVRSAGLEYLCEGDVAESTPECVLGAGAERARALSGHDAVALERIVDEFSGRPFRRAILARVGVRSEVTGATIIAGLARAHFVSASSPWRTREHNAPVASGAAAKSPEPTQGDAAMASAISRLKLAFPGTLSGAELAEGLYSQDLSGVAPEWFWRALFRRLGRGEIAIMRTPLITGRAADRRPLAFAPARLAAARGQRWAPTLLHDATALEPAAAALLARLDGRLDRTALSRTIAMEPSVEKGRDTASAAGRPQAASAAADPAGSTEMKQLDALLEGFERAGLLDRAPDGGVSP